MSHRYVSRLATSALLLCSSTLPAEMRDIPAHGPAVVLFDGSDLNQFETFLKSQGLNSDPEHVFQVEKSEIHISGREFGIITKKEYENYYLRTAHSGTCSRKSNGRAGVSAQPDTSHASRFCRAAA